MKFYKYINGKTEEIKNINNNTTDLDILKNYMLNVSADPGMITQIDGFITDILLTFLRANKQYDIEFCDDELEATLAGDIPTLYIYCDISPNEYNKYRLTSVPIYDNHGNVVERAIVRNAVFHILSKDNSIPSGVDDTVLGVLSTKKIGNITDYTCIAMSDYGCVIHCNNVVDNIKGVAF